MQTLGDHPERATAGDSSRDVFAFDQSEFPPRTATNNRSDPAVTRQQNVNDVMLFAQSAPNFM